jgi:(p)ppGpp synthase/HD superfamily hydrolase
VTWGKGGAAYPTEIYVLAQDRPGLLRDISEVFAREKFNVLGVSTLSQRGEAKMQFTVQVPDADATRRTLAQVQEVKGVLVARRRRAARGPDQNGEMKMRPPVGRAMPAWPRTVRPNSASA